MITPEIAFRMMLLLQGAAGEIGISDFLESLRRVADSGEPVVALLLTEEELSVLNARNDPRCRESSASAKAKLEKATEAFAKQPAAVR